MQSPLQSRWHVAGLALVLTASLRAAEPTVTITSPPPEATVRELRFVSVVFSEGVTNVDAAGLLNNSAAATNLLRISTIEYQFSFPQPATGAVSVAWAPSHGITDLSASPVPFVGGSWAYTLDPNGVVRPRWSSRRSWPTTRTASGMTMVRAATGWRSTIPARRTSISPGGRSPTCRRT